MPNNRLKLFQTLSRLTDPEFDALVFALNPPAGIVPSSTAAKGNRVSMLLEWAEGSTGCGLETLQQTLFELLPIDSKLKQEHDSKAAAELIEILNPHYEDISSQIFKAYRWALGNYAILQQQPDLKTLIRELDKRVREPEEPYTALQKFVAYLRSTGLELPLEITTTLKAWMTTNEVKDPNGLNRQIETEQAAQKQQSSCLLIKVFLSQQQSTLRQSEDRYFVRAWFIQDCNTYRSSFPSGSKQIHLAAPSNLQDEGSPESAGDHSRQQSTYTQAEIRKVVQQLRRLCANTFETPDSIHMFLPLKLINFAPDQWTCKETKGFSPLFGTSHQLVLRCSDRIYGNPPYTLNRKWERKWQVVERLDDQSHHSTLKEADPSNLRKFYTAVERYSSLAENADIVGVKLTQSLDSLKEDTDEEAFEILITESALPVALWVRQKIEDSACEAAINQVLQDCSLKELPEKIQQARLDAFDCDETPSCHIGNHLSLMWDDPYLVPPDAPPDAQPPQSA